MSAMNRTGGSISKPKRALFTAVVLLIPVLFFGVVESVVRLMVETPMVDDPFINIGGVPSFFKTEVIDGQEYQVVTHDAAYALSGIRFTTRKEPGSIRIFALGGSASAGWPHPRTESYSAYLQQALDRAFPEKKIEIINLSLHAYAAYRVRYVFDMLQDFDPDAFILYSGNNEFLESRTYLERATQLAEVTSFLNKSATYRLGEYFYKRFVSPENSLDGERNSLGGERKEQDNYDKWSKVARVTLMLREDPSQFAKLKEHYRNSIEHMVTDAAERDIPVVILTVPVNMRDWFPNVSRSGVEGDALLRWRQKYEDGRAALLRRDFPAAIEMLELASQIDPSHAETWFHLARAHELSGRYDASLASYQRAIDEDRNPFRALSSLNDILREIAATNSNATLADADLAMSAASAPLAPGFDLFLDYVHPTQSGNLVIAETAFAGLIESGLLGPDAKNAKFEFVPQPREDGTLYDESTDYLVQSIMLSLFGMMHQYDAMVTKAKDYEKSPDPRMAMAARVLEVFPPYLDMRNRILLGESVPAEDVDVIKNTVRQYYEDVYKVTDLPIDLF